MLIGRDAELRAIEEVLAAARRGRGGAAFATGEPGIGKSALLAAVTERAQAEGFTVVAGAAWEAGGAPAYWPWRQVLRDAARRRATAAVTAALGRLAPAGDAGDAGEARSDAGSAAGDATAARFALLESVVDALIGLAGDAPVAVLLDDLHAADLGSLDLLVLLARELPRAGIAVIGTWRDGDLAVRADAAQRLARASRGATVLPLQRLTAGEVAECAARAHAAVDVARLHERTEGNPLFVVEALRAGGEVRASGGVGAVIRDHLGLLRPPVADALGAASVLGRDLDAGLVATVAGVDADAVAALLAEATTAGVLVRRADGWSFAHVLVREELFAALPPSRRCALQRAAGTALLARDPLDPRGPHLLITGADGDSLDRAVTAARAAARHAADAYAFEIAAELLAAAVAAVESAGGDDPARDALRIELLIDLGDAQIRAGQSTAGKQSCLRAAELARRLHDGERFARAALGLTVELMTAVRDAAMIAILEEALAGLPGTPSPLRARVTARLAAALAPPPDHEAHLRLMRLADDALAMAEQLDDDETSLYVHRFVAHAYGYNVPTARGLELAERTCALAFRLHRPLEAIEALGFRIGGRLAARDVAGAAAARAEYLAIVDPVRSPHYAWRPHMVRASEGLLTGRFADVERHLAIAHDVAREHDIPRARIGVVFGRLALLHTRRSPVDATFDSGEIVGMLRRLGNSGGLEAWLLARAGRVDEARAALTGDLALNPSLINVFGFAEAAILLGDRAAAERVVGYVEPVHRDHPLALGTASMFLGAVGTTLGELYRFVGRIDDAVAVLDDTLGLVRAIGAIPHVVHTATALAAALRARGRPADRERADVLDAEAAPIAARLGIAIAHAAPPAPAGDAPLPTLGRDGDRWRIRWRDSDVSLPDLKGLRYLELLLASPDRDIHVHELIGDEAAASDAGEVLDATARHAYRERLAELGEALDEATRHHDLGRAERLRTEVDALTDELAAATGLGGRSRRAGSTVERARINVQRRLRDAIARIATEAPALGRYLEAAVQTGVFCRLATPKW